MQRIRSWTELVSERLLGCLFYPARIDLLSQIEAHPIFGIKDLVYTPLILSLVLI